MLVREHDRAHNAMAWLESELAVEQEARDEANQQKAIEIEEVH